MTKNGLRRFAPFAISCAMVVACGGSGQDVGSGSGGSASAQSFGGAAGVAGSDSGGSAGEGGAAGEPGAAGAAGCARFVTGVVDHQFGPGQDTGQALFPTPLFGPPKGGGCCQGSVDVVSLGNGGFVTLHFGTSEIVDGPGPDFIVFENAFDIGGDAKNPYAEPGTVAVSEDGQSFTEFPCTATSYPYGSCAGWHPVFANPDENAIDPLDPAVAGGDAFDLADIGVARARYVRITDRADLTASVFDLDAVGIVNVECR